MPETTTLIIIGLVVGVAFYVWHRISFWRKRVEIETRETREAVDESFEDLKSKLEARIEMLDGKPGLSKEEERIKNELEEALENSEKMIKKELEDVEKELD